MNEIIFSTNNAHKLGEVQALLEGKFALKTLRECGITEDIPETAETLEGNALLKARYVHERTGADCFADDTGLEVEALGGWSPLSIRTMRFCPKSLLSRSEHRSTRFRYPHIDTHLTLQFGRISQSKPVMAHSTNCE